MERKIWYTGKNNMGRMIPTGDATGSEKRSAVCAGRREAGAQDDGRRDV